ncbi:Hypothetical protein Cul131001_1101 [Corynebacterium ulcerans]|nr:Hypothetical protein Cul131001_1101 [Corynebacterium ulcerans]
MGAKYGLGQSELAARMDSQSHASRLDLEFENKNQFFCV